MTSIMRSLTNTAEVNPTLLTKDLTAAFVAFVAAAPDAPALRCADDHGVVQDVTRGELAALVESYAAGLNARGIVKGDRVVLALGTCLEFVVSFWAALMIGAVAVPVPALERRARRDERLLQIRHICQIARPAAIIVGADGAELALQWAVVTCAELASGGAVHEFAAVVDSGDLAVIQFTSGSTGTPKGCALTHRAMLVNAHANIERLDIMPDHSLVSWLPLFHDMGLMAGVLAPVVASVAVYLRSPTRFLVNPLSWLEDLSTHHAVHTAVPNFALALTLQRIARRMPTTLDLSGVRSIVCGAEPIDPVLVRKFLATLQPYGLDSSTFQAAYGMAEATLLVTSKPGGLATSISNDQEMVNVGRPFPGAAVRIVGRDGELNESSQIGEVQVRSPSMMECYFNNLAATATKISDGWLNTGDLGCIVDGDLHVTGRLDDLIIVGGRNIYPVDIENAVARVLGLPPIRIGAFGAPRPIGTAAIHVVIEAKPTGQSEVIRLAAETACIAACGVAPHSVIIVGTGEIPRTTSGKLRRGQLRHLFATRHPDRN